MNTIKIDVREFPEYAAGHIEGAKLVPLSRIQSECGQWEKHSPIELVCKAGQRARQAEQLLRREGFTAVTVLDGGMDAWTRRGLPVVTLERRPWAMERQVRAVAGSLVLTFVLLGYFVSQRFFLGAAAIGAGLLFAAVSNTCMMASLLGRMPWNRRTC